MRSRPGLSENLFGPHSAFVRGRCRGTKLVVFVSDRGLPTVAWPDDDGIDMIEKHYVWLYRSGLSDLGGIEEENLTGISVWIGEWESKVK